MKAGRIVLIVIGGLVALVGLPVLAAGALLLFADRTQTDDDGFLSTGFERFSAQGHAVVSEDLDIADDIPDWLFGEGRFGTIRIEAEPADPEKPVFIGVARRADADAYLAGVQHSVVREIDYSPFRVRYEPASGTRAPSPPTGEGFWDARSSGPGTQVVEWNVESGNWSIVVMNADGSSGVAFDAALGARVDWLLELSIGLLVGGGVLLIAGVAMVALGAHPSPRAAAVPAEGAPATPAVAAGQPRHVGPVVLEGELHEPLSRWLWLVKWILAIPHYVVLLFLWIAVGVLTVIAFFAVLFTGRYPRGMFDFVVGVMRWTWRVAFYSYGAIATDRYPPFSLDDEDYPARLFVDYPERLSRGLVLVKWWLLAIPHYIIVGMFLGGGFAFSQGTDTDGAEWAFGLAGVLVFFAGIALLFAARYPRGIFDFVMGMNRWATRVAAYTLLLRDDYPPFRLDQGPTEPERREEHAAAG